MHHPNTLPVAVSAPSVPADAGIFFPVALRPVVVDDRVVPGYVAVQREDTGQVLAFHREGYRLITNDEVFPAFEEALQQSNLHLSDMTVSDAVTHGGARTVRQYRFPIHQAEIQVGDLVSLQLKVVNSYDGALAFSSLVSGHRLACLNGMVVSDQYAQTYGRHTKGFDIDDAVAKLTQVMAVFETQAARWRQWTTRMLSDEEALTVFATLPQSNDGLLTRLMTYWQQEKDALGNTVWALFNAVTYWSTHQTVRQSSQGNLATIVLQRESQVRALLNSSAFRRLAG
jgi:hypothetical protein